MPKHSFKHFSESSRKIVVVMNLHINYKYLIDMVTIYTSKFKELSEKRSRLNFSCERCLLLVRLLQCYVSPVTGCFRLILDSSSRPLSAQSKLAIETLE